MKKSLKVLLTFLLACILTVTSIPFSFAQTSITSYEFRALVEDNPQLAFDIGSYEEDTYYLMLPSNFTGDTVTVSCKNSIKSVSGAESVDYNANKFTMKASNDSSVTVNSKTLMIKHTSLPAISISIDNGYSLDTIHESKENKIKAHVEINGTKNGEYDLPSSQIEMKTRGNTTFYFNKKPYQIKFEKKTSLFGMGKAKKWILLANYLDGTGVRNKVAFDLATQLGMEDTAESVFVDLYIDGEYNGVYQLIEKNEVGASRINLQDEKGVLLEMDGANRITSDDITMIGNMTEKIYVFKDYVTDLEDQSTEEQLQKNSEVMSFAKNYINAFEEALYDENSKWEDVASYIDVDSFIKYYFVNEALEQIDCTLASTYFYIDGPNDVLHCGPMWDFDRICGWQTDCDVSTNADYLKNMVESTDNQRSDLYKQFFRYPEFVKLVNDFYEETARDVLSFDNITGLIDTYQAEQWDSLMANFIRWYYVFLDRTTTMNEFGDNSYEYQVNYVTEKMKEWLNSRTAYLETAYGGDFPVLSYSAYGKLTDSKTWATNSNYTWLPALTGGSITYSADVKGISIDISNSKIDGSISITGYSGKTSKTVSESEKMTFDENMTGFSATLTGNLANYFDIEYRVLQNRNIQKEGFKGWSSWKENGSIAGSKNSTASGYGINKIQIRLIAKNSLEYGSVNLNVNGNITEYKGVVGNSFTPEDAALDGYDFLGWYTASDFSGSPVTTVNYLSTPVTLYAKLKFQGTLGDLNGDGIVSAADIFLMKKYLSGEYSTNEILLKNGDIDCDGVLSSSDSMILKKMLASS